MDSLMDSLLSWRILKPRLGMIVIYPSWERHWSASLMGVREIPSSLEIFVSE